MDFEGLNDALRLARDNTSAHRLLTKRGPRNVIVAGVKKVEGKFQLVAVTVRAEKGYVLAKDQYVVIKYPQLEQ